MTVWGYPPAAGSPAPAEPGRVLVVFDGLDELFDPWPAATVTHRITGFAARYPGARVLVTSRHVGYQRARFDAAGFGHQMLQDLDGRRSACSRSAGTASPVPAGRRGGPLAASAAHRDRGSRSVRELAGNPLLLTILAVIGRRPRTAAGPAHLYNHAVTVLVEHWEVSKHLAAIGSEPAPSGPGGQAEVAALDRPADAGRHGGSGG